MIKHITDVDSVLNIAKQNPHYFNKHGLELMAQDLIVDDVYGYYDSDKLVGFISLKKFNESVIEISWMAVLPEKHNQGIGSALVQYVIYTLKGNYALCKVKTLAHTAADEGYERTRHFYQKLGFISTEIIDPYSEWGEGNPCEVFIKTIE
jgi:ribosomal protein S18 acetylase RimI-like enzyme